MSVNLQGFVVCDTCQAHLDVDLDGEPDSSGAIVATIDCYRNGAGACASCDEHACKTCGALVDGRYLCTRCIAELGTV